MPLFSNIFPKSNNNKKFIKKIIKLKSEQNFTFNYIDDDKIGENYFRIQMIPLKENCSLKDRFFIKNNIKVNLFDLIESSIIYYIFTITNFKDKKDKSSNKMQQIHKFKLLKNISLNSLQSNPKDFYIEMLNTINSLENPNKLDKLISELKQKENGLNPDNTYNGIDLVNNKENKNCLEILDEILIEKNKIYSKIGKNESIQTLILKIFEIVLKFNNLGKKFEEFALKVCESNHDITLIEEIPEFNIFFNIWEQCTYKKHYFNEKKSILKEDDEILKFTTKAKENLNFIYDIIIPPEKEVLYYNPQIIEEIINLIDDNNFSIENINHYSEVKIRKCQMKTNQLFLMNILLMVITKEKNLNLLLFFLNIFLLSKNKKFNSFVDKFPFVDYIYINRI